MEDRQMNNEITMSNQAVANLNPAGATLLEMRSNPSAFPRVSSVPREAAIFEMTKIVTQAFLYRGQTTDLATINFISTSVVDELLADKVYNASSISFAEIQVIVKREILSGDVFGVSVASIYRIILDYVKGEGHLLQKQVNDRITKDRKVNPTLDTMLSAYSSKLINNNKIK